MEVRGQELDKARRALFPLLLHRKNKPVSL